MTLFFLASCAVFLAGGALHAQKHDPGTPATRELPAPPKVKSRHTPRTATSAPAPARAVQRDSTAKPAVPPKSKSAPAATSRQPRKLPRVEKPAKPGA